MEIDPKARAYLDALTDEQRPLFDRVQRLVVEQFPDATVGYSYQMPTFAVGDHRLYVGVWKRWVSLYGWDEDHDGGFSARHLSLIHI